MYVECVMMTKNRCCASWGNGSYVVDVIDKFVYLKEAFLYNEVELDEYYDTMSVVELLTTQTLIDMAY